MKIHASKTEVSTKLTYTKADIQNAITEDLTEQGYRVDQKVWNETNSKLEITAVKLEKKGGKS
jgi:hypothetical protein